MGLNVDIRSGGSVRLSVIYLSVMVTLRVRVLGRDVKLILHRVTHTAHFDLEWPWLVEDPLLHILPLRYLNIRSAISILHLSFPT